MQEFLDILVDILVSCQAEKKGSIEFQILSFTDKMTRLNLHLKLHKKDYSSERGLRKILGKRDRLLAYLSKKDNKRYKALTRKWNIREIKKDSFF
uniref:30S ribosomal protein S15 n=1 Tax=Ceratostigma willmottianum TaxID=2054445 RepID=A0A411JQ08_9CARY|nr:ribosomal protein S15 [Ceratostigma willmottianum]QBC67153.1 ribosomal protein S15 [Ceratostigma willmottianum]WBR76360.1 ribosomal protein S15 [Ceratostigma willmottianum]